MAIDEYDPVVVPIPANQTLVSDSTRDDVNVIQALHVIPELETRFSRFSLDVDRVATIVERSRTPTSRFSVDEMISFLNDAAIQVVLRTNSRYLSNLRMLKSPVSNAWDFSDCVRILGSSVTIDGTTRCQRISEDHKEDILARGATLSTSQPLYTMEGGQLWTYGNLIDNPVTSTAIAIKLPKPVPKTATGTYVSATKTFTSTSGDLLDEDLHTLVNARFVDSGGNEANGIFRVISQPLQSASLDIDSNFIGVGTVTATWETPAFSLLYENLQKPVVALASSDMFAAMGDIESMNAALSEFQSEMEIYGLNFFKV